MAINRYFKLFLNAGAASPLVINVNQYDKDELWHFTLLSETGEQHYPNAAAIVGKKNDGNLIANAATVDGRGYVNVTETEQMTAAPGVNYFELLIDGQIHGTANFIVLVEPSPTEGGVVSDSDLSLIQQAMDSISPAVIAQKVADWMDENLTPTTPPVDASLTVQGAAADAKKTGEEISDLKSQIALNSGVPTAVKNALDKLFQNVAFKNTDVYTDELAVVHNWAMAVNLISISAVFEQGENVIYDRDSLDTLKQYLTVNASYDNGLTETLADSAYALSGTLSEGTSTITVTYDGKSTTFNVNVTKFVYTFHLDSIVSGYDCSMGVGNNATIVTTTNANRAVSNPLVVPIPAGTYRCAFPSVCKIGVFVATKDGTDPSLDSVDWANTGTAKTWYTGNIVKEWNELSNAGWNFVSGNTFTMAKDGWLQFHFQAVNGGSVSSESWRNTILEGLSFTEVES